MPVARVDDQRIRSGIQAVVDVTTTYAIKNFALQSDQGVGFPPWVGPDAAASTVPTPAEIRVSLSKKQLPNGDYLWSWVFSHFTQQMYKYWLDTFFNTNEWWGYVTVMDYDWDETPIFLTGIIHRPSQLNRVPGGYSNVPFAFTDGAIIT